MSSGQQANYPSGACAAAAPWKRVGSTWFPIDRAAITEFCAVPLRFKVGNDYTTINPMHSEIPPVPELHSYFNALRTVFPADSVEEGLSDETLFPLLMDKYGQLIRDGVLNGEAVKFLPLIDLRIAQDNAVDLTPRKRSRHGRSSGGRRP
jgi:hypothetical protein